MAPPLCSQYRCLRTRAQARRRLKRSSGRLSRHPWQRPSPPLYLSTDGEVLVARGLNRASPSSPAPAPSGTHDGSVSAARGLRETARIVRGLKSDTPGNLPLPSCRGDREGEMGVARGLAEAVEAVEASDPQGTRSSVRKFRGMWGRWAGTVCGWREMQQESCTEPHKNLPSGTSAEPSENSQGHKGTPCNRQRTTVS